MILNLRSPEKYGLLYAQICEYDWGFGLFWKSYYSNHEVRTFKGDGATIPHIKTYFSNQIVSSHFTEWEDSAKEIQENLHIIQLNLFDL